MYGFIGRQYSLNEYQVLILEIYFHSLDFTKKISDHVGYGICRNEENGSEDSLVKYREELDHWLVNYCELIRSLIQKNRLIIMSSWRNMRARS